MSGTVSEREQKILGIIETTRAKKAKFRDAQITMAHGAGGKATQGLIEGLLLPAFGSACTPERPIGTCMVSSEGACAAYYNYGRFAREREVV